MQTLDDRSTKIVFMGKEHGSKAHRVYDPSNGWLNVSRDVVFEENKGWNWNVDEATRLQSNGSFVLVDTYEDAHLEHIY